MSTGITFAFAFAITLAVGGTLLSLMHFCGV